MKVESLKDLGKIMVMCKKHGVGVIKIDNVEFHIDLSYSEAKKPVTPKLSQAAMIAKAYGLDEPEAQIDLPDELTPEQLLEWSLGPQQGE